jgi:hypothetical protein
VLTAMQYIPSGTNGVSRFHMQNQYQNGAIGRSVQWSFSLSDGVIAEDYDADASASIIYDEWVELKLVIDLDNDLLEQYYNGELFSSRAWVFSGSSQIQSINLYGNGASSVYYDDIMIIDIAKAVELPEPVGHWTLDDGAGTLAADSSGNGNDGTLMDNPDLPDPTWIDGVYGGALEFHGTGVAATGGDFINCGNDASLDITSNISIALWIRPDADDPEGKGTSGGETAPMSKASSDWSYQVRYGWASPQPYMCFTFNTAPRAWVYVGQNLTQGEWCHIACSHDGETLKCYLDGVETDSTPMGEIHSSADPVLIGSDGWGSDWIGGIDDVRIYDVGLTEAEINAIAGL